MSLVERYQAGYHLDVYTELLNMTAHQEAHAVARSIMRIVRANIEELGRRWRERGLSLSTICGNSGEASDAVREVSANVGPLYPTLSAFYEEIGWVDFVEGPPGPPWPDIESIDSLQIDDLEPQLEHIVDEGERALVLFADPLTKFDFSGVGPIYVPLTETMDFDATLHFEGQPMRFEDGSPIRFVPYLRKTILARGGIGLFGAADAALDAGLITSLTRGLERF